MSSSFEVIQKHVGNCREELDNGERCNEPSEYLLWGKLIEPEGLGPRCYMCAAKHILPYGLSPKSGWALVNLSDLAHDIDSNG